MGGWVGVGIGVAGPVLSEWPRNIAFTKEIRVFKNNGKTLQCYGDGKIEWMKSSFKSLFNVNVGML